MMRFKLDENLHPDTADLLRRHGHDAMTVYEQGLQGHDDQTVAEVCKSESRALITLDVDFADVRAYPPTDFPGMIVLRLQDQSRPAVLKVLGRICSKLVEEPLTNRLWIVDEHHIRVRGVA
jgi:predicted nuclease of predicted toxin-antitoxin system